MITGYTVNKPEQYCRFTLRTFHNGVEGSVDEGGCCGPPPNSPSGTAPGPAGREQQPALIGDDPSVLSVRPRHRGV